MLNNMRISTRLTWQALGMAFWFAVLVVVAATGLRDLSRTSEAVYVDKLEPGALVLRIQTLMAENNLQVAGGLLHDPSGLQAAKHDHELSLHIETMDKNRRAIDALWQQFTARTLNEREAELAESYRNARAIYVQEGLVPAAEALGAGDYDRAADIYAGVVRPAYAKASQAAEALRLYYADSGRELFDGARQTTESATQLLAGLALLVTLLVAAFSYVFGRSITRPLAGTVRLADEIADGRLDNSIAISGNNEVTELLQALDKMQAGLKCRIDAERLAADATMRIKVALDVTSNNVMVADPAGTIIYCNAAVLEMMRQAESDIRSVLPDFRADAILGSNFDRYHRQPAHQRNLLATLQGLHRSEMSIGGRHFVLTASPIINEQGERLGAVVEWRDRTAEVEVEREVAGIIAAAVAGDFSKRLDHSRMSGFYRDLSAGINQLLEASSAALADVGAMLDRMSQGDLRQQIDGEYQGVLGKLKDDANSTVDNLQQIVLAIKGATDAINTAAKEIAAGNQDLSARTEEQASSLEETASSMEELTGTVKQNAQNARQASELAGAAQQVAVRGGEVVGQVVDTMSAIHRSSSKIGDIIGVIDGIAFQTNILALNAAVEAARAGEQGRGFAVVATEVRNLAQRSAAAAKEIKGLIADSVDKVEVGNRLVDQAGRTMEEVVGSIRRVANLMQDISEASREQSAGIEQVSLAISQMDEVTQQNAALVEQAAAAAESLEEQANALAREVAVFALPAQVMPALPAARPAQRPALGQREPVRLSSPSAAKTGLHLPAGSNDEWTEF
ncbi:MAG: diguanylate cyclase [Betaproteobacteria bacterium HGW-Betaproteobacteria-12]|nr:MAG: diguanylate cyclase [Betaproteobacteria bacterium HGW-Betaproteobacteria-12]